MPRSCMVQTFDIRSIVFNSDRVSRSGLPARRVQIIYSNDLVDASVAVEAPALVALGCRTPNLSVWLDQPRGRPPISPGYRTKEGASAQVDARPYSVTTRTKNSNTPFCSRHARITRPSPQLLTSGCTHCPTSRYEAVTEKKSILKPWIRWRSVQPISVARQFSAASKAMNFDGALVDHWGCLILRQAHRRGSPPLNFFVLPLIGAPVPLIPHELTSLRSKE